MFYNKFDIKFDLFTDIEFSSSKTARTAKKRDLQTNVSRKKYGSSSLTTEEL